MPNAHDVFARHLNLLRKCGNKSFVLLLAQSFDGHQSFGREMGSRHAGAHDAHQNGLNAYATEPGPQSDFNSDSPASTRGGSLGYMKISTTIELRKKNRASFGLPFFLNAGIQSPNQA
jgi:hypothetical protein